MSPKAILIFLKTVPNFKSDTTEKEGIINLSSYSTKCYASVVLSDSKVTFHEEEEDKAFCPFLCVLFMHSIALHNRRHMSSNFLAFHTFRGILSEPAIMF